MLEVSEKSSGKVVGLKVNGKLLHEDYQQLIPKLEKLIEEQGSIRCLFEMTDFHGFTLRALWDEMKFDVTHCTKIERCAVVGNRTWQKWAVNFFKPLFFKATIKFFNTADLDTAWQWIGEGVEQAPAESPGARDCRCATAS